MVKKEKQFRVTVRAIEGEEYYSILNEIEYLELKKKGVINRLKFKVGSQPIEMIFNPDKIIWVKIEELVD